jgi:hypothetical protein
MRTRIILVLSVAIVLAWVQGLAQSSATTIEFSGLELRIGMPKDSVVARLAESYHLEADKDHVTFFDKDRQGMPSTFAGKVDFRNGKLAGVTKFWRSSVNKNEQEFADSFFHLVSTFEKRGIRACTIGTYEIAEPGVYGRNAYIRCGARSIGISSFHPSSGQELVQIVETLAGP